MNRLILAVILVLTLWAMLMVSGCATIEEKMIEMKLAMTPWADDKPLMLDTTDCRLPTGLNCFNPGPSEPFMLGPLHYDDMLIALHQIK
jgi:hypothetical protein